MEHLTIFSYSLVIALGLHTALAPATHTSPRPTWCFALILMADASPCETAEMKEQCVRLAALISVQARWSMFLKSSLCLQWSNMCIISWVSTPATIPSMWHMFWQITICREHLCLQWSNMCIISRESTPATGSRITRYFFILIHQVSAPSFETTYVRIAL